MQELPDDRLTHRCRRHLSECARVDDSIGGRVADISRCQRRRAILAGAGDDPHDRQFVARREVEVTLVMSWHAHDRASAVLHEHVIGDPDRHLRARHRIERVGTGEDAGLFLVADLAGDGILCGDLTAIALDHFALCRCGDLVHQRMLRRQHDERRTEQRVDAGGVDRDATAGLAGLDVEGEFSALAPPDPVPLRRRRRRRPVHLVGSSRFASSRSA